MHINHRQAPVKENQEAGKISAKESKIKYEGENISNYFLGVISANQGHNKDAFRYLNYNVMIDT